MARMGRGHRRGRVGDMGRALIVALGCVLTACTSAPATPSSDGGIADSISPADTEHAAIRNLDPHLRQALQDATLDAGRDGVELRVTSGWRSKDYQQRLLDDAVAKYGSLEEARRFVNTPDRSTHVSGDAVDIGPTDAADWMSQHGADYGLCQAYANEIWHFELLTTPGGECPPARPDAS
jgi:hypothetical protein